MAYVQLAFGIISLIMTIMGAAKNATPVVEEFLNKKVVNQPFYSVYQGNDPYYRYWSDPSGKYWMRLDVYGRVEYSENPNLIVLN
jgi:hypothetical protein